jgi:hypothetical protein
MEIFAWFEASSWAVPMESLLPKKNLPEGWVLIKGPQSFTKKTLFEHINGEAELFFKYGFQKSVFAIYQNKEDSRDQIELDIYEMGNVVEAFGIFSRFRSESPSVGIGLDSCLNDHSIFFYKGRFFIMGYATESNPDVLGIFSKSVELKISDPSPPPKEINYFPKSGLKPGSIQYFPEGLLGHQFLKRGFQGIYIEEVEVKGEAERQIEVKAKGEIKGKERTKEKEFQLFLAIFKDSQETTNALKAYKGDLSKKGNVLSGGLIQFGTRALHGEDPYQGKVIVLQKGLYLVGAIGFENEKYIEDRLAEFLKKIK